MIEKQSRPVGNQAAQGEGGFAGLPSDVEYTIYIDAAQAVPESDKRAFREQHVFLSDFDLQQRWWGEQEEVERLVDVSNDVGPIGAVALREAISRHEWMRDAIAAMMAERDRTHLRVTATPTKANDGKPLALLTADEIMTKTFPEPVWAVPKLLPVGLTLLAGKPKTGKSFLALQLALSVASGGMVFGERVTQGKVLFLALEDTPRRLQDRMKMQNWSPGLSAEFLTIGQFDRQIGDLRNGGGKRLADQIDKGGYRFVVIDTLSRSVRGDQNDAAEMTRGLTPIQEIAHAKNVALLLIDHHRKASEESPDAIIDLLGSTAKGAMADTIFGLYRESGKAGAKLRITGRDVAERTLAISMDWLTGSWQLDGDADEIELTERRQQILDALADMGRPVQLMEVVKIIDQPKSHTYTRLQDLCANGLVRRESIQGKILYSLTDL